MTFDDEQGSIGELRDINNVMRQGFVDIHRNPIKPGFYTNSTLPGSFYFLDYDEARNLIIESPNSPSICKLIHNYEHLRDVRVYNPIPIALIETIHDASKFIKPRLQKQKTERFNRITLRVLDRILSPGPFVR